MKILVIYASNSGSTYFVSERIKKTLEKSGHLVEIVKANEVQLETIQPHDVIILGSCTWQYESEEGGLHEHFHILEKNMQGATIIPTKFAIFGLGDSSYFKFCNAVNHLEDLVKSWGKTEFVPPLRINRFYADQEEKEEIVKDWTEKILEALSSSPSSPLRNST